MAEMRKKPLTRRLIQLYAALLYNAHLKGFAEGPIYTGPLKSACVRACPMDIRSVGDSECVQCGNCIDLCPARAITFRAGKIVLRGPELGEGRADR